MIREIELDLDIDETSKTSSADEIRGVMLPLHSTMLILPNVTVAEVIGYRDPDPIRNAPAWLMGSLNWRQHKMPLISYEFFVHKEAAEPGYRSRIAVCHNLSGNPQVPFIGIMCNSIPRLVRINNDTIVDPMMLNALMPEMTLKQITYQGEEAWIPDIEGLAKAAAGYL